jgi:uncharacterized protein GlcG (DUF336 family)
MGHTTDIPHGEARALIARAIDKAEDLAMRGGIAVVGASGALVSASRMDHGGAGGMARARSKAWIAATQQIRSTEHLRGLALFGPLLVLVSVVCSPDPVCPAARGMPGWRDGAVIAGVAASGAGIGPFVDYPGADRQKLIADGKPANGEDLLVHYALGIPYVGQHGDDLERWIAAYGPFPEDAAAGLGMAEPPPASRQPEHDWALGLADQALAVARERGFRVTVAIVDHRGDPIQQDRMDGAPSAGVAVAEGVAAAAATFQCSSRELPLRYPGDGALALIAAALPFRIVPVAGGLPLTSDDGVVVAGIGVGGPEPSVCEEIAAAALGGDRRSRP